MPSVATTRVGSSTLPDAGLILSPPATAGSGCTSAMAAPRQMHTPGTVHMRWDGASHGGPRSGFGHMVHYNRAPCGG